MPKSEKQKTCGIVMPISECDGRSSDHWSDVRFIIQAVANEANYDSRLVSDTFETNLIHTEILGNIYNDDIVICDVSAHNPNVFFELGIRMATQKPVVIVKDNETSYPFDTSPNRYIEYPRDLRHPLMEAFKLELSKAIERAASQKQNQSFIGQLGSFKIPEIKTELAPADDIILDKLNRIESRLRMNETINAGTITRSSARRNSFPKISFDLVDDDAVIRVSGASEETLISLENDIIQDVSRLIDSHVIRKQIGLNGHRLVVPGGEKIAQHLISRISKFSKLNDIEFRF